MTVRLSHSAPVTTIAACCALLHDARPAAPLRELRRSTSKTVDARTVAGKPRRDSQPAAWNQGAQRRICISPSIQKLYPRPRNNVAPPARRGRHSVRLANNHLTLPPTLRQVCPHLSGARGPQNHRLVWQPTPSSRGAAWSGAAKRIPQAKGATHSQLGNAQPDRARSKHSRPLGDRRAHPQLSPHSSLCFACEPSQ